MVQENTNMVLMIMNDGGYGVMRGIQNNYFGGRQYFNELHTPDYKLLGESMGVKSWKVGSADEFKTVIQEAVAFEGPTVIELDMKSIGPLNFGSTAKETVLTSLDGLVHMRWELLSHPFLDKFLSKNNKNEVLQVKQIKFQQDAGTQSGCRDEKDFIDHGIHCTAYAGGKRQCICKRLIA